MSRPLVGTAQSQSTSYFYDGAHPGDLVMVTDPANQFWQYAYDAYGNRVKKTDPMNFATVYRYDGLGRQTSTTLPDETAGGPAGSDTWTKTYFASNRVQSSTDPIGNRTQYTYDENWNPKTVLDALAHTTTFTYDYANQLTQTQAPLSTTSTAATPAVGSPTSTTVSTATPSTPTTGSTGWPRQPTR